MSDTLISIGVILIIVNFMIMFMVILLKAKQLIYPKSEDFAPKQPTPQDVTKQDTYAK